MAIRRRQWHPTPVLLPGKSHERRSLVGCSPWGLEESDTTEWLHFPFSLSCIGEGNGNPLQCSCLENPRDGGAWWAAVYGVAQSRTWLKRLSSSSSSIYSLSGFAIYFYCITLFPSLFYGLFAHTPLDVNLRSASIVCFVYCCVYQVPRMMPHKQQRLSKYMLNERSGYMWIPTVHKKQ